MTSVIAQGVKAGTAGGTATTSNAVDTSAAKLVVLQGVWQGGGAISVDDNKGNVWTPLTLRQGTYAKVQLWYSVIDPSKRGAGHTFTFHTPAGCYPCLGYCVLSGDAFAFDQECGAGSGSVTSFAPGSLTPSEDNCVLVCGLNWRVGTSPPTVNGGFSENHSPPFSGNNIGCSIGSLLQGTLAAANPLWSWAGATDCAAAMACFKTSGGGTGGGLSAGVLALSSVTTTSANLSFGATSGGTGTYSNHLQRSLHGAGSYANVSSFSGATATLADSALSPGTQYDYRVQIDDGANIAYSNVLTVTTVSAFSPIIQTPLRIGAIGDSVFAGSALLIGQDPLTQLGQLWNSLFGDRAMTIVNRAAGGTSTSGWVAGTAQLNNAMAAFAAAGMIAGDPVLIGLGINDALANTAATTFKSNLQSVIGVVLGAGFKPIPCYPTLPDLSRTTLMNSAQFNLLAVDYPSQIDSLIGSGVYAGDKLAPGYFYSRPSEIGSDGIHENATGAVSHSRLLSIPLAKALSLI